MKSESYEYGRPTKDYQHLLEIHKEYDCKLASQNIWTCYRHVSIDILSRNSLRIVTDGEATSLPYVQVRMYHGSLLFVILNYALIHKLLILECGCSLVQ